MEKIDILQECKEAKSIGLAGHIRPDGDAIGSTMALKLYLKNVFPDKEIKAYFDTPPTIFSGIKEIGEVESDYPEHEPFDVFIALDTTPERLSGAEKYFRSAKKTINIDHHESNANGSGMVNYVEPKASSTAELVYLLMEKEYVDEDIAKAIYIGIIHDTGVFNYSCTSPRTMRVAADLMEFGFDFSDIIEKTFYAKTYVQQQLLARAIEDARFFCDGRIIAAHIDRGLMESLGAMSKHMDGIVSQLRYTRGVSVSAFMYEMEEMKYKISLRSNGDANVALVGQVFGGGGHERAAGLILEGDYESVLSRLIPEIEKALKN